ncbi:MAG: DUF4150 domain-containing protein [Desulfobacterales bacterium]|nr:DUF4150 domain-containing protein [Desulfobacterales bacterium]
MPATVFVNGLALCHAGSAGIATASMPDVCLTPAPPAPPIPIPYPNIAKDEDLVDGSATVSADGGNSIAMDGCKIAQSTGDEGGAVGGVSSGVTKGEAVFITFSPDVTVEGAAVCRHTDKLTMNMENTMCTAGIVIAPGGAPATEQDTAEDTFSMELELLDEMQNPIAGAQYQVKKEDDTVVAEGTLDDNGYALVENLEKGKYYATYPEYKDMET